VASSCEILLIGGRSGVGKSSVAVELHEQLSARHIEHALIEGDNLDLAYPPPWEHGLAERNLAAIWRNYSELGYRRLVYTNTNSVLNAGALSDAMGAHPRVVGVLLTASDDVVRDRLARREIGSALDEHVERSRRAAARLENLAPPWVVRVDTDARTTPAIAAEVAALTGWLPDRWRR
jgi:serine kinase of HPr protein (carbohydrate metabolism regulator)